MSQHTTPLFTRISGTSTGWEELDDRSQFLSLLAIAYLVYTFASILLGAGPRFWLVTLLLAPVLGVLALRYRRLANAQLDQGHAELD